MDANNACTNPAHASDPPPASDTNASANSTSASPGGRPSASRYAPSGVPGASGRKECVGRDTPHGAL